MNNEHGYSKGEKCNRDGCQGIINEHSAEGCCSCHINPPCSYCTTARGYCPECDWDGRDEQMQYEKSITEMYYATEFFGLSVYHSKGAETYRSRVVDMIAGKLPRPNCLMYLDKGHTHFSMIKEGVFPECMSVDELVKEVKGTFGRMD